jgi:carbon storage regulator CsrA
VVSKQTAFFIKGDPSMLLLSRKAGQRIRIGNDVTLVVLAVHGNRVRLGFEAPGRIPINREEVLTALAHVTGQMPEASDQLLEPVATNH